MILSQYDQGVQCKLLLAKRHCIIVLVSFQFVYPGCQITQYKYVQEEIEHFRRSSVGFGVTTPSHDPGPVKDLFWFH